MNLPEVVLVAVALVAAPQDGDPGVPQPAAQALPRSAGQSRPVQQNDPELLVQMVEARTLSAVTRGEVQKVAQDQDKLKEDVRGLATQVYFGSLVFVALCTVLGFLGWSEMKKWATARLDERLKKMLDERVPQQVAVLSASARDELIRTAQVLALHSQRAYDDVLAVFGSDVPKIRQAPPVLRRSLIDALYHCKANRDECRAQAWTLMAELGLEDSSLETLRLYLQLATSYRKYAEGFQHYQHATRQTQALSSDEEAGIRASTILRKLGRTQEALDLASRFKKSKDFAALVAIAVLQRDLGEFGEADDLLRPAVKKIVESRDARPSNAWNHVVNTYIALCIDQRRWAEAMRPAEFVMRKAPGAVEVFTICNLLLKTPADQANAQARAQLIEDVRRVIDDLDEGEAVTRVRIALLQLEGKNDDAVHLAEASITEAENRKHDRDSYHLRTMLGMMLSDMKQNERARAMLVPAASYSFGGEAKFNLAVVYARLGNHQEAALWLRSAGKELPRWTALARGHEDLRAAPHVSELLQEIAAGKAGRAA